MWNTGGFMWHGQLPTQHCYSFILSFIETSYRFLIFFSIVFFFFTGVFDAMIDSFYGYYLKN
jgi:hypothetical protein